MATQNNNKGTVIDLNQDRPVTPAQQLELTERKVELPAVAGIMIDPNFDRDKLDFVRTSSQYEKDGHLGGEFLITSTDDVLTKGNPSKDLEKEGWVNGWDNALTLVPLLTELKYQVQVSFTGSGSENGKIFDNEKLAMDAGFKSKQQYIKETGNRSPSRNGEWYQMIGFSELLVAVPENADVTVPTIASPSGQLWCQLRFEGYKPHVAFFGHRKFYQSLKAGYHHSSAFQMHTTLESGNFDPFYSVNVRKTELPEGDLEWIAQQVQGGGAQ